MAVLAGIFAIVPAVTWAATGRWRDALHAAKGYAICLGILGALSAVFVVAAFIGSIP